MLAITICATKSYYYVMPELLRAIKENILLVQENEGHMIFSGDGSDTAIRHAREAARIFPKGWLIHSLNGVCQDREKANDLTAHKIVSELRTAAFNEARKYNADECWSLDSDVIPPTNALRAMRDAIRFDGGYYSVATCPYPAASGLFLFGRGNTKRGICENIYRDERDAPKELLEEYDALEEKLKSLPPGDEADQAKERAREVYRKILECPVKGDVHTLNGIKWRRRGWGQIAYPAIGKGAVVPTDWCGFGCTLMNQRALSLIDFDGYPGVGTEDMYIIWNKWHPAGIRIAAIPHAPCDHIIRSKGCFVRYSASHETEGETEGHLRVDYKIWKGW